MLYFQIKTYKNRKIRNVIRVILYTCIMKLPVNIGMCARVYVLLSYVTDVYEGSFVKKDESYV